MTFLHHDTAGGCSSQDRAYAESKLTKLGRYLPGIETLEFRHRSDRFIHHAEVWMRGHGYSFHATASDDHLRAAIDTLVDRAAAKLRRAHKKQVSATRHSKLAA